MKWIPRIPFTMEASWQIISTVVVIGATLALLLFSRLDSMLPGYSPTEIQTARASQSLGAIFDNPVQAPYKLVVFAIATVTERPILATRITSAIVGTLTILLFYFGVRKWHSARVSFLATLLFGTSAWFLHAARFGGPEIMFPFSILLVATLGYWVASRKHSAFGYLCVIAAMSISLFVPGMIWFLLAALLVRRGKDIKAIFSNFSWIKITVLLLALLVGLVVPVVLGFVYKASVAIQLLGLPSGVPNPAETLQNIALIPVSLFAATSPNPEMWLSNLPYLDIFSTAMFILGGYYYFKYRSLDRAKLLLLFLVFASVLVALKGVGNTALLPGIYIAIAGGIALLLTQWMTVFPRNPLAQTIGITLITIAIVASSFYNLKAYFIAWPNSRSTNSIYSLQREDLVQ
jgi:hypothetical protein